MLKKTIVYTDYNGEERKEDFYFNLTKAELIKLQLGYPGGYENYLHKCLDAGNVPELLKVFDELIDLAYGEKDDTGRRFVKSKELTDSFKQTEAYSEMFTEFITNEAAAKDFFLKILPGEVQSKLSELNLEDSDSLKELAK